MSAWGILKVEAGNVRWLQSSPPNVVTGPASGAITTHSPAPTAGGTSVISETARACSSMVSEGTLARADGDAVVVLAVQVDERDEGATLVGADGPRLRDCRDLPA